MAGKLTFRNKAEVIDALTANKINGEEAKQALADLSQKPVTYKVADKGGVSVYGLGSRFPTTLYASQWERLLTEENIASLKAFIKANERSLSRKDD